MKFYLRFGTMLLAVLLLVSGCKSADTDSTEAPGDPSWVLASENYTVTTAQFTYFYNSYCSVYESYADYFGIDTGTPLDQQEYSMSGVDGYTWHDYFMDAAKTSIEELLVLCEAAHARGITLDEDEQALIEENVSALRSAADNQGMTVEELVESNYGETVTVEDVRACLTLQSLAAKTEEVIEAEPVYTEEDLNRECEENPDSYYGADYRYFEFVAQFSSASKTSEIAEQKAKAKAAADKLFAASDDEESFLDGVEAYLREEIGLTDEEIEEELEATLVEKYAYNTNGDFSKWLFEQDSEGTFLRKAGEVKTFYDEDNGSYTVCMVLKPYYRDDYATRSVRHILISTDSYDAENGLPDAEAKAEAERILDVLKADGVTDEEFAQAAKEHSMDDGSAADGGIYSDAAKGDMVDEFDQWLFDSSRVQGDTGIVKTEYGYHIMYYVGEGEIKWKSDAEYNLRTADYETAYAELFTQYTVRLNEYAMGLIKSA